MPVLQGAFPICDKFTLSYQEAFLWFFEVLCGFVAQTASLRWTN